MSKQLASVDRRYVSQACLGLPRARKLKSCLSSALDRRANNRYLLPLVLCPPGKTSRPSSLAVRSLFDNLFSPKQILDEDGRSVGFDLSTPL